VEPARGDGREEAKAFFKLLLPAAAARRPPLHLHRDHDEGIELAQ